MICLAIFTAPFIFGMLQLDITFTGSSERPGLKEQLDISVIFTEAEDQRLGLEQYLLETLPKAKNDEYYRMKHVLLPGLYSYVTYVIEHICNLVDKMQYNIME